ncbi:serine/threonine protein kinase, partial [bacterium]|nr:serine/threonine protein kinase [bacterium]
MAITFACPVCGGTISVADESAGGQGPCPHCRSSVLAPSLRSITNADPRSGVSPAAPLDTASAPTVLVGPPLSSTLVRSSDGSVPTDTALATEIARARADPRCAFGRYLILGELGRGGMGVVHRAWDERLRRIVALKTLQADLDGSSAEVALDALHRFQREAEAVARLRHPNIVAVHEVGELKGRHFIAMDYIEGVTLARRLQAGEKKKDPGGGGASRLPLTKAIEIVRDVARAVHHAHEQGVVHRDLKPQNIMLDGSARPFVLDFGLARIGGARSHVTRSGTTLGTPAYMPPEQADTRGEVDARSDVYSLGATLYHVL